MSRRAGILLGLALVLLVVNGLVVRKELLLREGTSLFLALAPQDPRSLIQGDYMRLEYSLGREVRGWTANWPRDGRLVVRQDQRGVAQFVRRDEGGELQQGERYLRYRIRGGELHLGAESFFFQEGHAERYDRAKFAELKVTPAGDSVLVGLRGEQLEPLGGDDPRGQPR